MNSDVIGSTIEGLLPNTIWGWLWWIVGIVFAFQCYYQCIYPVLLKEHWEQDWTVIESASDGSVETEGSWRIHLRYPRYTASFLSGSGELFVTNHYTQPKPISLTLALVDADPETGPNCQEPHCPVQGLLVEIEKGQGNTWSLDSVFPGTTVSSGFVWHVFSTEVLSSTPMAFAIYASDVSGRHCLTPGLCTAPSAGGSVRFPIAKSVRWDTPKALLYSASKLLLIPPGSNILIPAWLLLFVALSENIALLPSSFPRLLQTLMAVSLSNILVMLGVRTLVAQRLWTWNLLPLASPVILTVVLREFLVDHPRQNLRELLAALLPGLLIWLQGRHKGDHMGKKFEKAARIVSGVLRPLLVLTAVFLLTWAILILPKTMEREFESLARFVVIVLRRFCLSGILWGVGMALLFPIETEG